MMQNHLTLIKAAWLCLTLTACVVVAATPCQIVDKTAQRPKQPAIPLAGSQSSVCTVQFKQGKKMKLIQQAGKRVYQIVPVPSEEFAYLTTVISTALEYLTDAITLEQAEKVFGQGEYHYPKDPKKPITDKDYFKNILSVSLKRKDGRSNWSRIDTGLRASDYQETYYALNLDAKYFNALVFEKAETFIDGFFEEHKRAKNRFTFKLKEGRPTDIRVVFIADTIYSDVKDRYPRNFEDVSIIRLDANGNDPTQKAPQTVMASTVPTLTITGNQVCPKSGWWTASTSNSKHWKPDVIAKMPPHRVEKGQSMPSLGTPSDTAEQRATGNASIVWTWQKD
jgi:hypothetical protein